MSASYTRVREDELDIGLAYALDKYNVTLCREALRIVFNETLDLSHSEKVPFHTAKKQVLDDQLEQRTKEQRRRFTAYSSAVAKIGNRRAQLARQQRAATARKPRTAQARKKARQTIPVFLRGDQYAFI